MTTLDLYRHNFISKTVVVRGFVYRSEGINSNQFAIARFQMQCCTADSMPFGIIAETPQARQFGDGAWVGVKER